MNRAQGTVRRVFLVSTHMKEAVSQPPKAKVKDDQKIMSLKRVLGIMVVALKEVAEPKRCHAMAPMPMMITTGSHIATAPTLCSHLPTLRPTTFMPVLIAKVTNEKSI